MFCRLETTKRTQTSIFALLCLLQGIARVKFYCFACQVCREISQTTSSLLFRPRKTRSSTRFSITAPFSSILDACEFRGSSRGSRLERHCQLTFERYCMWLVYAYGLDINPTKKAGNQKMVFPYSM